MINTLLSEVFINLSFIFVIMLGYYDKIEKFINIE